MGKMYSNEEVALTRELLNSIDYNKYGEVSRAFEKAYAEGKFPNRSMTSVLSMASRIKTKMVAEAEEAARQQAEEAARAAQMAETEQLEFTTTVAISERILREKHEAEYKLEKLREALITDAIGLTDREQLMYNFNSLHHALLEVYPADYAAKLDELKAIYGR